MKNVLAVVVLLALVAVPTFGEEGTIPRATLRSLGLGDMQTMSDAQGMQVRGQSSAFGIVKGTSLVFGQLLTPDTKNFVVGSSVNEVDANAETTAVGMLTVTQDHHVFLNLNLDVVYPGLTTYSGVIMAGAGGIGSVSAMTPW